jgi:hypothetical protein
MRSPFARAYYRVRLWMRRHGTWPAERGRAGLPTGWRWSVFTDVNANDDPLPTAA